MKVALLKVFVKNFMSQVPSFHIVLFSAAAFSLKIGLGFLFVRLILNKISFLVGF